MAASTRLTKDMLTIITTGVHPFILKTLGSTPEALAHSSSDYHPSMAPYLPEPSDARGILDFFGLSSSAADRVLSAGGPNIQGLPGIQKDETTGRCSFPLSDALLEAYHESAPPVEIPFAKSYEGYLACALQQGLRPEFACRVGLHPQDVRFERLQHDFYDVVDPQEASRERVVNNKFLLNVLWYKRMKQEGEASV
jgi:hypothetical protein